MRYLLLGLLFFSFGLVAQNKSRSFSDIERINNRIKITVNDGEYYISAYTKKIVECSFIPNGQKQQSNSHTISVAPKQHMTLEVNRLRKVAYISTGEILVKVNFSPFKITYLHDGYELISEGRGYEKDGNIEKIQFNIDKDEILYGGGARALGMNRRGNKLQLYNRAHYGYEEKSVLMNYTIPMVLSSKRYAIHFDNPQIGALDLDSKGENLLTYETIGGRKVYQVIIGEDWKDLTKEYTYLTGRQPLPPRWMFGNFASRFGYHSEQEARNVVQQYKDEKIPLDAIIFDLYWFGKDIQGTLGNLSFYRDSFPNGEQMIFDFRKENVKTVLITEPFILTTSSKWKEAVEKEILAVDSLGKPFTYDFYFGNTGLIDLFKPNAREWFWDIYKGLLQNGVEGFWGDLGEPEVHPAKLLHGGNIPADEVHNIYGHEWAKLIAEGYKKDFPQKRPFILMRSGYSGTQRYGIIPWSGDVNRTWGGLKPQMEITMQMGMQGIPYMHSDLGGFAGANDDSELYTRWLQYGVFQPVFRPHAQEEVAAEPIFKDPETKRRAKEAIELRYALLPYNYSLAFANHMEGTPLMRPVFMVDSAEHWSETLSDAYMWGDAFFVKPITEKLTKKYSYFQLPKQSTWFDFYTGKKVRVGVEGASLPNYIAAENTMEHLPVYVRSGSFIPMANSTYFSTESYNPNDVSVHFYVDEALKKSGGIWFEDDGITSSSLQDGQYQLISFNYERKKKFGDINVQSISLANSKFVEQSTLVIHLADEKPEKIKINNKKTQFQIADDGTISIPLTADLLKKGHILLYWK